MNHWHVTVRNNEHFNGELVTIILTALKQLVTKEDGFDWQFSFSRNVDYLRGDSFHQTCHVRFD